MAIRFDGRAFAAAKEQELAAQVQVLKKQGRSIVVHTTTFTEDAGSRLYTKLKHQAAIRVGIEYKPQEVSIHDSIENLVASIQASSSDPAVTGVMVQKPSKQVWMNETGNDDTAFAAWWETLTQAITPTKDVDCLTQTNLDAIYTASVDSSHLLLPATVAACRYILNDARITLGETIEEWRSHSILVLGRSAIVGKPLAHVLSLSGHVVVNVGKDVSSIHLKEFPIIISAVGVPNLITGSMIADQSIVVDVGSPVGDFEQSTIDTTARFYTPVPGGVGPVTISCLLENCIQLGGK